jgi:hypothetical protein
MPAACVARLEERRHTERLWQRSRVAGLDAVLTVLADAQVPALALKGPVLSERLHGDPLNRLSNDVDILVSPGQLDCALHAVATLGYQLGADPTVRYNLQHHHHLVLDGPGRSPLELHFRLYAGFGVVLEAAEFLERSLPYQTARGSVCRVLAPEDELLYLGIHAAGHGCERLAWLYDIKTLLLRHPDLNWASIFARARAGGVVAALAFALDTTSCRIGVPSDRWNRFTARYRRRGQLAGQVLASTETLPCASLRNLGALVFQSALCDRPVRSIRHASHHLGRIARRRLRRYLPWLTPETWAG